MLAHCRCALGEPGVGKTAIVEVRQQWLYGQLTGVQQGIALRIAAGEVPSSLQESEVISVDMAGRCCTRLSLVVHSCCGQRSWLEPSTGESLRNGLSRCVEAVCSGLSEVRVAAE